jgi:hypothetical protein
MKQLINPQTKIEYIHYCECGQSVRLRKRDGVWTHTGYNRIHEPYSDFLARTNHTVKLTGEVCVHQKGKFGSLSICVDEPEGIFERVS